MTDVAFTLADDSLLLLPCASLTAAAHDELETWSLVFDGDQEAPDQHRGDPAMWTAALGAGSLAVAALQGVVGNAAWAAFPAAARYLRSLRSGRPPLDSVVAAARATSALAAVCAVAPAHVSITAVAREAAGTWRVEAALPSGRTGVVVLDPVGAAVSVRIG